MAPLGVSPEAFCFVHIGDHPPILDAYTRTQFPGEVEILTGPVVETILPTARER